MYGLLERDLEYFNKAFKSIEEIEEVILFGSRAIGNYKKGSDVDLAVIGGKINNQTLYILNDLLNEVFPLPYFFDILDYNQISNKNIKQHIDIEGKIIYTKLHC